MYKFFFTIITLLVLVGCDEKKQPQELTYKCSDYKTITDKKIKEELVKKCPSVVGTENIKKSNNNKNKSNVLSELNNLPD